MWRTLVCLGVPALSCILSAGPEDWPRVVLPLAVVPFVMAIGRPPLADLARRLAFADVGKIASAVLDELWLAFAVRWCWLAAMAGSGALLVRLGVAAADGSLPAVGPQVTAELGLAALGLACGFAGIAAMPRQIIDDSTPETTQAWPAEWALQERLAVTGGALVLAFELDTGRSMALGLSTALMPAQLLATLLALVALPWLGGRALAWGIMLGSAMDLVLAGTGRVDGASATLAGVVVNFAAAVLVNLQVPAGDASSRAHLQRTLTGPLRVLNRPIVWMCCVLWAFLALGPGWLLLREHAGGPRIAAIAATVMSLGGWLWLQSQKRTSQLTRP